MTLSDIGPKFRVSSMGEGLPLESFRLTLDEAGTPATGELDVIGDARSRHSVTNLTLSVDGNIYGPLEGIGEYNYRSGTTTIPVIHNHGINWGGDPVQAAPGGMVTVTNPDGTTEQRFDPNKPPTFEQLMYLLDPSINISSLSWFADAVISTEHAKLTGGRETASELVSAIGYRVTQDEHGEGATAFVSAPFAEADEVFSAPFDMVSQRRVAPTLPSRIIVKGARSEEEPESDPTAGTAGAPTIAARLLAPGQLAGDVKVGSAKFPRIEVEYPWLENGLALIQWLKPQSPEDAEAGKPRKWEEAARLRPGEYLYVKNPEVGNHQFRAIKLRAENSSTEGEPSKWALSAASAVQVINVLDRAPAARAKAGPGEISLAWDSVPGRDYRVAMVSGGEEKAVRVIKATGSTTHATVGGLSVSGDVDVVIQPIDSSIVERVKANVPPPPLATEVSFSGTATGGTLKWRGSRDYIIKATKGGREVSRLDARVSANKTADGLWSCSIGGLSPATDYEIGLYPVMGGQPQLTPYSTPGAPDPETLGIVLSDADRFAAGKSDTVTKTVQNEGGTTVSTTTRTAGKLVTTSVTTGNAQHVREVRGTDGKYTVQKYAVTGQKLSESTDTVTYDSAGRELTATSRAYSYGYTYDAAGVKTWQSIGFTGRSSTSTWDAAGYRVGYAEHEEVWGRDYLRAWQHQTTRTTHEQWTRVSESDKWAKSVTGYEATFGPDLDPATGKIIGRKTETAPIAETSIGVEQPQRHTPPSADTAQTNPTPVEPEQLLPASVEPSIDDHPVNEASGEIADEIDESDERGGGSAGYSWYTGYELEVGGPGPELIVEVPWLYGNSWCEVLARRILTHYQPYIVVVREYWKPVGARRNDAVRSVEVADGPDGFSETVTTAYRAT